MLEQKHAENKIMQVNSMMKHVKDGSISLNHPLQREAMQWDGKRKGNFIRRLLWGDLIQHILLCSQIDNQGRLIKYIIDGKQRVSTIREYMRGDFAISAATTKPIIEYTGVVYETVEKHGKNRLKTKTNKITKQKEFIPVYEEILKDDGTTEKVLKRANLKFDIRGARFFQLPPELQEAIAEYNIPYMMRENCTDEEIQQEIIDFNSGAAMRVEQKGVAVLGVDWATKIAKIKNSYFIKNCYISNKSDEKYAKIERRIVESLCILYLDSGYKKNYEEMCRDIAEELDIENLKDYDYILKSMTTIFEQDKELAKYIGSGGGREYPVVVACYNHFKDDKSYAPLAFKKFLIEWIEHIKDQKLIHYNDEMWSYVERYKDGTTDPEKMKERIAMMNKHLDKFLEENCEEYIINAEESDEDEFIENFSETELALYTKEEEQTELANRCLMALTPSYPISFENDDVYTFISNTEIDKTILDNCIKCADIVGNALDNIDGNNELCSIDNIPLLLWVLNTQFIPNDKENEFRNWLLSFVNECAIIGLPEHEDFYAHRGVGHGAILTRKSIMEQSVIKYFNNLNNESGEF